MLRNEASPTLNERDSSLHIGMTELPKIMIDKKINNILLLQFESLLAEKLFHFSTTIPGGMSEGNYTSLNLGNLSDDEPEKVLANRRLLAEAIAVPIGSLFVPAQTHDDKFCVIDKLFLNLEKSEQEKQLKGVDALITNELGVCIGVTTADCVPILVFDSDKKVLAAIHAGWRGTVARIVPKTIAEMISRFGCRAQDMMVGIAPSISPEMFEVGDEVGESLEKEGFDLSPISYRHTATNKLHIDLWETNRRLLVSLGVLAQNIEIARLCTYSHPDRFFSARRQTIHSGRMITGGYLI